MKHFIPNQRYSIWHSYFASYSNAMRNKDWNICPNCGLPNIPERRICKRCRIYLHSVLPQFEPHTNDTGKLYRDTAHQRTLFLSPNYLEYDTPQIGVRAAWSTVWHISHAFLEDYLYFSQTPLTVRLREDARIATLEERRIPLRGFGYTRGSPLAQDLRRYAPQLR